MSPQNPACRRNWWSLLLSVLVMLASAVRGDDTVPARESAPQADARDSDADQQQPARQLLRGKVVRLPEALARRDLRVAEEMDNHVVLETRAGELIPILADWRGRAFYQDERLRDRPVELVGFRREGIPYLQVLMVFTFDEDGSRQYTDYWCDICSIPMYEIKPCDCCQAPIRLRFQPQDLPEYLEASGKSRPAGEKNGR